MSKPNHRTQVNLRSYWAAFDPQNVQLDEEVIDSDRLEALVNLPGCKHYDACLWAENSDGVYPVLIVDRAQAAADHLKEWAEGQPQDWFKLVIADDNSKYCVGLYPDMLRSVNRWEHGYERTHGRKPPERRYKVVFQTLHFGSAVGPAYHHIKPLVLAQSSVAVGLLDTNDFDLSNPSDASKIVMLGRFPLANEEHHRAWATDFLADLIQPATSDWIGPELNN